MLSGSGFSSSFWQPGNSCFLLDQELCFRSSTWCETFVIFSLCVSSAISDLERFRDSRIRHYTVNQGVTSIFGVDRPR